MRSTLPILGPLGLWGATADDFRQVADGLDLPPLRNLPKLGVDEAGGKRSATGLGRPGSRPSILARTGSKSTNHDLNKARAITSSVSFICRFSSILSSSVPRICAMARCSGKWSGSLDSKCGTSAHLRLSTGAHVQELADCESGLRAPTQERRIDTFTVGAENEVLAKGKFHVWNVCCFAGVARRDENSVLRFRKALRIVDRDFQASTPRRHAISSRIGMLRPLNKTAGGA